MTPRTTGELAGLRAKAQLYDELVEHLALTEHQLAQARSTDSGERVDRVWREIANDLAGALRPYTLFREQRIQDGRIVVETRVPGPTLKAAGEALDRLGRQVAVESYRADGIPIREDAAEPDRAA